MKKYKCKDCGYESGSRHLIRKHIREEHLVKGGKGSKKGFETKSAITASTITEDV